MDEGCDEDEMRWVGNGETGVERVSGERGMVMERFVQEGRRWRWRWGPAGRGDERAQKELVD